MPKLVLSGGNGLQTTDDLADYLASNTKEFGLVTFAKPGEGTKYYRSVIKVMKPLGVNVRHVTSKEDLEGLALLHLFGGRPDTLLAELMTADMAQPIYDLWRDNKLIIGGDSAGVMVLFELMEAEGSRMAGDTELTVGLGFLRGAIAAVHWDTAEPGWKRRFLEVHREKGILAIDEYTSLVWEDGKEATIGPGEVKKFGQVRIEL